MVNWGCFQSVDMDTGAIKTLFTLRDQWPRVEVLTLGTLNKSAKVPREDYEDAGVSTNKFARIHFSQIQ
eukprot:1315655-Amorphochlora_amoeboformis.AAC.3